MMPDLSLLAERFLTSDAFLIITGAGMGVPSGFATFRGEDGLWPKLEARLGVSYLDWATPEAWFEDPELCWGFYGTRLQTYREAPLHEGYLALRRLRDAHFSEGNAFWFTTNVDGHAPRAFPENEVLEKHGSLLYAQDLDYHSGTLHDVSDHVFDIDPDSVMCSSDTMPRGSDGKVLRSNVLLFDDFYFNSSRCFEQTASYLSWQYRGFKNVFILEIGCGDTVTTGRHEAKQIRAHFGRGTHVRLNPSEEDLDNVRPPIDHVKCGALEGILALEDAIKSALP